MAMASPSTPLETLIAAYESTLAAERHARALAEAALSTARSTALSEHGYALFPIGTVASPLLHKRGAPRQGALAPALRARVNLTAALDLAAIDGLEAYSHVWLLYLFHDDEARAPSTPSTSSTAAAAAAEPPWVAAGRLGASKISPPGMGGGRTGVLSTRSPHRPNALALTLCALDGVDRGARQLLLSGCDAIHGSPVVDVKPYIARADTPTHPASVRMPSWVAAPLAAPPPLQVHFAHPQLQQQCLEAVQAGRCSFYSPGEGQLYLEAVTQVMGLDTRSVHQGRGSAGAGGHVTALAAALAAARLQEEAGGGQAGAEAEAEGGSQALLQPPPYVLEFDALRLSFRYTGSAVCITAVDSVA
jgi:tRNA (Thr-GGU) A37 N-methylase